MVYEKFGQVKFLLMKNLADEKFGRWKIGSMKNMLMKNLIDKKLNQWKIKLMKNRIAMFVKWGLHHQHLGHVVETPWQL